MNNVIQPANPYDVQAWQRYYEAHPGIHRSVGADTDPDPDPDPEPTVTEQIAAAVDKAVDGLKRTNADLKTEKKDLSTKLNGITSTLEKLGGNEGIENLLKMKQNLEKDDLGKLLTEGKHDEWFDQRTAAMRKDFDNQMSVLQEQVDGSGGTIDGLRGQLRSTVLRAEVLSAAKDAGTLAEATADIQLRAERAFTYDDERKTLVVKDDEGGVLFGKDGKSPKGVAEWLEEQKAEARHWWPASKGGGAGGSGDSGSEGSGDLSKMSFADFKKKRMDQKKERKAY